MMLRTTAGFRTRQRWPVSARWGRSRMRNLLSRTQSRKTNDQRRNRRFRLPFIGSIRSENLLLLFTLLAVIAGTLLGLFLNPLWGEDRKHLSARHLMYLQFPGEMFMRMLRMLILPMVIASNISAIASLNAKAARIMTGLSLVYYVCTTLMAVTLGITLVFLIQPGKRRQVIRELDDASPLLPVNGSVRVADSILDLIRNMIPENIIVAGFQKTQAAFVRKLNWTATNLEERKDKTVGGTNILGLITFSILFGFAVHSLGPDASVLADVFHAVRRVCVYLVSLVIWFSPIGIMCLIAEEIAKIENLAVSLVSLSFYVVTVMTGLFVHGVIVLPLLLYFFTKRNPMQFAYNMLQALMCALGTASSTATLPCTIRCLEGRNQIDPRVTRFMLPLGTSINMDGTALYQAIAVVYIAQTYRVTLGPGEVLLVGLTAALASMAAASMPSAGMITMVMVLTAVDLPDERILLLWPVDWFLDRFRTMVNVFSDSVGAAIVSKLCENKLAECARDPALIPEVVEDYMHLADTDNQVADAEATPEQNHAEPILSDSEPPGSPVCVYLVDDETIVLKF